MNATEITGDPCVMCGGDLSHLEDVGDARHWNCRVCGLNTTTYPDKAKTEKLLAAYEKVQEELSKLPLWLVIGGGKGFLVRAEDETKARLAAQKKHGNDHGLWTVESVKVAETEEEVES